jgi:hypothetical protein
MIIIYDIKEAMRFYRQKYPKYELPDKFVSSIGPVIVILKPRVYNPELGEYVETGESRKMSFDSFLY